MSAPALFWGFAGAALACILAAFWAAGFHVDIREWVHRRRKGGYLR